MARILIVDDEEAILIYLEALVSDHGHEVIVAQDADEGLAAARAQRPDVITLDVMMPKRSGISLYCELKRDPVLRDTPVVFISGFTQLCDMKDPESIRRIIPDHRVPSPEACFEKPLDIPRFLAALDRLVGAGA